MGLAYRTVQMSALLHIAFWCAASGHERDCCQEGALYHERDRVCRNYVTNSTTPIILQCDDIVGFVNGTSNTTFSVRNGTSITFQHHSFQYDVKLEEYCIATIEEHETALVFCGVPAVVAGIDQEVAEVLFITSACFFAITAAVYTILPELRDLQGKVIASLCASSGIGQMIMASLRKEYANMELCTASGFIAYYFMVASFFWMNAFAVQVYRSIRKPNDDGPASRQFLYYCLYAWGCPAILLVCVLIADFIPSAHYVPGFGVNDCWFQGTTELWIYFYSPLAILLIGNCAIFARLILLMYRSSNRSQRARTFSYKIWMSTRLFVVIGVMWVFELASSVHGQYHVLWLIADIYNLLQGVLIFILLVVMRRRVLKALARSGFMCNVLSRANNLLTPDDEEVEQIVEGDEGDVGDVGDVDEPTVVVSLDKCTVHNIFPDRVVTAD